jgi:hypothetical protein
MSPTSLESFRSLHEALDEIRRLRKQVEQLEQQLEAVHAKGGSRSHDGDEGQPQQAASGTLGALERFARQIETARDSARQADPSRRGSLSDSIESKEELANRHLTELRDAIQKLREERAQASVELLKLTRLNPARMATVEAQSAERTGIPGAAVSPKTVAAPVPEPEQADATPSPVSPAPVEAPAVLDAEQHGAERPPVTAEELRATILAREKGTSTERASADRTPIERRSHLEPAGAGLFDGPDTTRRASRRWLVPVAAALVMAIAGAAVWLMLRPREQAPARDSPTASDATRADSGPQGAAQAPQGATSDAPTSSSQASPPSEPASVPPSPSPPAPIPGDASPPPTAGVPTRTHVEIVVAREVWMRVDVDGERLLGNTVAGGRTLTYDVGHTLVVRAGDAGAVSVVVDGESRGALGADGAVLTRTFQFPSKP